jgi:hypothetical protein
MKTKQIIILSVIFGVLALGILLKSWIRSAGDKKAAMQENSVALAEFDPLKLERVLISRGSQASSVELVKENSVWKVKSLWNAKADSVKVEKLIQKLHSARGELRVSGKRFFPDFGIQDEDAFSIKLFGAGDALLQDFRVGTKQAGESAFFIRKAASEKVYLVDVNMAELLGIYSASNGAASKSDFWADLSLFNLNPEKAAKITLYLLKGEEKTRVMGLEREADAKDPLKSSWKFMHKATRALPDPDKVLKFIAAMNSLRAQKAVDPGGKEYDFEKPVWQLSVTEDGPPAKQDEARLSINPSESGRGSPSATRPSSQGGKKTLLNAGPKDEKKELCYVNRLGDPSVFELNLSFFNDLNVDDTHFFKDAPPAAKPENDLPSDIPAGPPVKQGEARPSLQGGSAEGQGPAA